MNDDPAQKDPQAHRPVVLEIREVGQASDLTRGSSIITPWVEFGVPPKSLCSSVFILGSVTL